MRVSSEKTTFKTTVRESTFENRESRRQRKRRAPKATVSTTITTSFSDRANVRDRRRKNRQNRRADTLTKTKCVSSSTLDPEATDFHEVEIETNTVITISEIEQEDDAFYQEGTAKLSFDSEAEEDETSDLPEATGIPEPTAEDANSSSETAAKPVSSYDNHTNASETQAQGSQSYYDALVNSYDYSHLPTAFNTKLRVYDDYDDIQTYEDYLENWPEPDVDEADLASQIDQF